MAAKICQVCESRGGLPHMKESSHQKFIAGTQPEVIVWVCPICGYSETETNTYEPSGGTYNSGAAQGPIKSDSPLPPDRPQETFPD